MWFSRCRMLAIPEICGTVVSMLRRIARSTALLPSGSEKWFHLWVAAGACVIYALFPTKTYYWDGVKFALRIDNFPLQAGFWTDPNHLLYAWIGGVLKTIAVHFGFDVSALVLLQCVDIIAGAVGIVIFAELARHVSISRFSKNVATVVFAFSAAWWNYSVDVASYVLTLDFMMLTLLVCLRRPRHWQILAIMSLTAATTFHQLAALFSVPLAAMAIFDKKRYRSCFTIILVSGVISISLQYYAYKANDIFRVDLPAGVVSADIGHVRQNISFYEWIFTHSSDSGFAVGLRNTITGLFSGNLKLGFGGKLGDISFVPLHVLIIAISVVASVTWFVAVRQRPDMQQIRFANDEEKRRGHSQIMTASLLVWLFVYVLFLLLWMPLNSFYRVFYLPPLLLLLGVACDRVAINHYRLITIVVGLSILWNFLFYIYPRSVVAHNEPLVAALKLREKVSNSDRMYYRDFHTDNWTIRYFNMDIPWYYLDKPEALQEMGGVWVDQSAWQWLSERGLSGLCFNHHDEVRFQSARREIIFRKVSLTHSCPN